MMESPSVAVIETLNKALSQNIAIVQEAETQLKLWEKQIGFYPALLDIMYCQDLPNHLRLVSMLYLKNNINSFLDGPDDEIVRFLQKLLSEKSLSEPDIKIAKGAALLFRRISCLKVLCVCQHFLPVLKQYSSLEVLPKTRVLLYLNALVSNAMLHFSLESKNKDYLEAIDTFSSTVYQELRDHSQKFLKEYQIDFENSFQSLHLAYFCLKLLKSNYAGRNWEDREGDCFFDYFPCLLSLIHPCLQCRISLENQTYAKMLCEKFLITLVKVFKQTFNSISQPVNDHLQILLEYCASVFFSEDNKHLNFEQFSVQFLLLLQSVVSCANSFRERKYIIEKNKTGLVSIRFDIIENFFSYPVLKEIVQQLTSKYLLLTVEDLDICERDPESYASVESFVQPNVEDLKDSQKDYDTEFTLRASAEQLIFTLNQKFKRTMLLIIASEIDNNAPIDNDDDLIACFNKLQLNSSNVQDILKKEAVYALLGLGTNPFVSNYDVEKWLSEILVPELKITDYGYSVIRKRVLWVIQQWHRHLRENYVEQVVFAALGAMHDENLLVRIAAVKTLQIYFDYDVIKNPVFPTILTEVLKTGVNLCLNVQTSELKAEVLKLVSDVIKRAEENVQPHLEPLSQFLNVLWRASVNDSSLQSGILSCFTQIVKCLKQECATLFKFLFPLLQMCLKDLLLLEDGLELWLAFVENLPASTPELFDLFSQNIKLLFENIVDEPQLCVSVIEGYLYLSPEVFIKEYGGIIAEEFETSYKDYECLCLQQSFCRSGEWYIEEKDISLCRKGYSNLSWIPKKFKGRLLAEYQVGHAKVNVELFWWIFEVTENSLIFLPEESITTFRCVIMCAFDLGVHELASRFEKLSHLRILARLLLKHKECFSDILQQKAKELNQSPDVLFGQILDAFLKYTFHEDHVKLFALALTCLLTSGSEAVASRLMRIINYILKALSINVDFITNPRIGEINENFLDHYSSLELRKEKAKSLDPVFSVNLSHHFHQQLSFAPDAKKIFDTLKNAPEKQENESEKAESDSEKSGSDSD